MSDNATVASDPSVADYRATSPYEWGGMLIGERKRWPDFCRDISLP
jgi:hypothetical protein